MDFIGLTDEGNRYIQSVHYAGVYEYTLSDGAVAHLRMFRHQRMPITCSMGGVTEVVQEYVGGKLFTCLVYDGYFLSPLWSTEFFRPTTQVAFKYSPERQMWVIDKPVSLTHAFCMWKRGDVDGTFADFDAGIIPESWFTIQESIKKD